MVFNEIYETHRARLKADEIAFLQVKVSQIRNDDEVVEGVRINVNNVATLDEMRGQHARGVLLSLNGNIDPHQDAKRLFDMLKPFATGKCPVTIEYAKNGIATQLQLNDGWRITPAEDLVQGLRGWLKPENVAILY
jgi:DNA polymerase III subunit alpha